MDDIEALASAEAAKLYADAWGGDYDPDDEGSRVAMEQLVTECKERIENERAK